MYGTITLLRGAVLVFVSLKVNPILLYRLIIIFTVVHSYLLLIILVTTYTSDSDPIYFSRFAVCPHFRVLSKLRMSWSSISTSLYFFMTCSGPTFTLTHVHRGELHNKCNT
jgi:hypothetical protein